MMKKQKTTIEQKMKDKFNFYAFNFKYQEGITFFDTQMAKNPTLVQNESILYMVAFLCDHLAEYKKDSERKALEVRAQDLYKKILKKNPNSTKAIWGLGRILWHNKDEVSLKYAVKAFNVAKKIDKPLGAFMNIIGVVYLTFKHYKKAETWFLKALKEKEIDPDNVYLNLLNLSKETDNKKQGEIYLEKFETALKKAPLKIRRSSFGIKLLNETIPSFKKWLAEK